jgi:hypothetical protein
LVNQKEFWTSFIINIINETIGLGSDYFQSKDPGPKVFKLPLPRTLLVKSVKFVQPTVALDSCYV